MNISLTKEALKWRNFGIFAILTVRKCYWTVRISLTAHSQAFQHIFECGHTHITSDMSEPLYNDAYPFMSLVYTLWLVFK